MSARFPTPPAPFTGAPAFRSTALPRGGAVFIRGEHFPRFRIPARFATREARAEAVRDRRLT